MTYGIFCVPEMWWIVSNEIWYILCARNVVNSWCARHVMKYGMLCAHNVVDSWCARQVMKYDMFCVPNTWCVVGVPAL